MQPYYDDGQVVIYHGDCRDVLPLLSDVAVVLTDPPYASGARRDADRQVRGSMLREVLARLDDDVGVLVVPARRDERHQADA
jgi:DNA modification methylase